MKSLYIAVFLAQLVVASNAANAEMTTDAQAHIERFARDVNDSDSGSGEDTLSPTTTDPTPSPTPSPTITAPTTTCTVTSLLDGPDHTETLRGCIQQAMAAGGDWNIGFDIQDGISTADSHVIELEPQTFAPPSEIGGWSDSSGLDTRSQIGFRIYENPAKPALKITINGTTQTLSTLDAGRPSNAKRITIQPKSLSSTLIFAQIGLKGSISTGGGVLVFAGLRIANFGSLKWDKKTESKVRRVLASNQRSQDHHCRLRAGIDPIHDLGRRSTNQLLHYC